MPTDRDLEGDSEMLSDSSSPDQGGNRTSTNAGRRDVTAESSRGPSGISPPASQDAMALDPTSLEHLLEAAGEGVTKTMEPATLAQKDYVNAEPGSGWNNKKALEEYHRALESVVDRDFNLDEFGDPFDERDMKI
ncbi:hypothetical protein VTO42DRAFT_5534 [Malbranchea cinnamomea]